MSEITVTIHYVHMTLKLDLNAYNSCELQSCH